MVPAEEFKQKGSLSLPAPVEVADEQQEGDQHDHVEDDVDWGPAVLHVGQPEVEAEKGHEHQPDHPPGEGIHDLEKVALQLWVHAHVFFVVHKLL